MDIVKVLAEWHTAHPAPEPRWVGLVECGICGHAWTATAPVEDGQMEPIIPLECPECGNLAGHLE